MLHTRRYFYQVYFDRLQHTVCKLAAAKEISDQLLMLPRSSGSVSVCCGYPSIWFILVSIHSPASRHLEDVSHAHCTSHVFQSSSSPVSRFDLVFSIH
jgi:hypothetical protein